MLAGYASMHAVHSPAIGCKKCARRVCAPYRSRVGAAPVAGRIIRPLRRRIVGGVVTDTDIARQRLVNQRIEGEKFEKPEEVVRWLGAMQAQDYLQALWAIGLRLRSATVADVERAIADGKILRTWPMRGTLHFVPPEEARWRLKLSASRILARDGRRLEQLGLDRGIMGRCKELFYEALGGNRRLTRPEIMQVLEEAGIGTQNQRGYHILWYLSQEGVICPGPNRGKQQTFVLLDEWVPDSIELSR